MHTWQRAVLSSWRARQPRPVRRTARWYLSQPRVSCPWASSTYLGLNTPGELVGTVWGAVWGAVWAVAGVAGTSGSRVHPTPAAQKHRKKQLCPSAVRTVPGVRRSANIEDGRAVCPTQPQAALRLPEIQVRCSLHLLQVAGPLLRAARRAHRACPHCDLTREARG